MLLVPLAAALVAVVFAGHLARQFARRRRPHALAWALALGLYAAGSAAVAVGLGAGWSAPVFVVYWLAGPLVNVLARPFSFTFLIVVGGAIWSAVQTRRWSVPLIAVGVVIVAGDSVAIRVENGELFSFLLAAGITVIYAGFLATTRPRRPAAPAGAGLDSRRRGA
jgi:hypothetical protein